MKENIVTAAVTAGKAGPRDGAEAAAVPVLRTQTTQLPGQVRRKLSDGLQITAF